MIRKSAELGSKHAESEPLREQMQQIMDQLLHTQKEAALGHSSLHDDHRNLVVPRSGLFDVGRSVRGEPFVDLGAVAEPIRSRAGHGNRRFFMLFRHVSPLFGLLLGPTMSVHSI